MGVTTDATPSGAAGCRRVTEHAAARAAARTDAPPCRVPLSRNHGAAGASPPIAFSPVRRRVADGPRRPASVPKTGRAEFLTRNDPPKTHGTLSPRHPSGRLQTIGGSRRLRPQNEAGAHARYHQNSRHGNHFHIGDVGNAWTSHRESQFPTNQHLICGFVKRCNVPISARPLVGSHFLLLVDLLLLIDLAEMPVLRSRQSIIH